MFDFVFLFFGASLVITGFVLMIFGLVAYSRDNYKPRHTRSTYLPNRKR